MPDRDAVIVGGGVSGLSTAYFLAQRGIRSTLVEKSGRLGGLIKTDLIEGCQIEAGPDSYLAAKTAVSDLADELDGLRGQTIGSNDEERRIFVVRNSRLMPMPRGMVMMAPAEWGPVLRSGLFSVRTKLRFVKETFFAPHEREADISLEQLVLEHFGREVLEYVAAPLLSGVYGGDSDRLSARSVLPRFLEYERKYGSIVRGVRQEKRARSGTGSLFLSFRGGMQSLTDSLARAIAGSTDVVHGECTRIQRVADRWRIHIGDESMDAEELVLACPAHAAARLLGTVDASLSSELATIPYSSAILGALVYERSTLRHPLNGFGFLVPRAERKTIAAATWVSTKFPSRTPPELAALRAFIVAPEANRLLHVSQEEIMELVRADFERLMGIEAAPKFSAVSCWPDSMPQYVVGHEARGTRIAALLKAHPSLHLAGNAYSGVGIPDCVRLAKETANAIDKRGAFGE